MLIFQLKLKNVKCITIEKLKLFDIFYIIALIIIYKTIDAFIIVTSDSSFLIYVSLIIKACLNNNK